MKKVLSLFTVFTMVIAMSVCAFAAEITINPAGGEENFEAYQIFSGDVKQPEETGVSGGKLSDAEWGTSVANADDFVDAFNTAFTTAISKTSETVVEDMIDAIINNTTITADKFADLVAAQITAGNITGAIPFGDDNKEDLADGYYFVRNTSGNLYTKYILNVVGQDFTVQSKTESPTIVKKVQEDHNSKWGEVADYSIGEAVPFRLVGTLPKLIGKFDKNSYVYSIMDNLQDDKFGTPKNIKVYLVNDDNTTSETLATTLDTDSWTATSAFSQSGAGDIREAGPDGNLNTEDDIITYAYDFSVYTNDLAAINAGDTYDYVVVEYTAELIAADIATALNNEVKLKYSNNPNEANSYEYDNDDANVYTFDFNIDKVDQDGNDIKDATFALFTDLAAAEAAVADPTATGSAMQFKGSAGEYVKATTEEIANDDPVSSVLSKELKDDGTGDYSLKGLDEGTYYLVEIAAPDGFNKLKNVTTIIVESEYDAQEVALTGYGAYDNTDGTGVYTAGSNTIEVENRAGLELPETGGVGTTLFYVIGGLMMACATIVLVSRKRMAK